MKLFNTKEMYNSRIKIALLAPSGAGKTFRATTLKEPTLVLSVESGLLCLQGHDIDAFDLTLDDDGKVIPPAQRIGKLVEAYKLIQTPDYTSKYKWIFIDSLSEISQCMVAKLEEEFPDRSKSMVMWGENLKRMTSLVKSFRDLPYYNVVFTSLVDIDKDENSKRIVKADLAGKISTKLNGYLDEVFYIHVDPETQKRKFQTGVTDMFNCKDRSGALALYEDADLQMVADKIRAKTSKKEEKK